jgi:alginate O-acetyltransferase complex protein AlgI
MVMLAIASLELHGQPLVRAWIGMAGLVFALHFGVFHLLSCLWRSLGVPAVPIMQWPIASTSVSEFWGRRWNLAFRDLAHRFVFRPLATRWGGPAALAAGFLVSGLVHDAVISVPARGGYGLPTLFFLIQAAGVAIERSAVGRRSGLGRGFVGWMFTAMVLLLPAPLLFHPPFVHQVVLSFFDALGNLLETTP